MYVCALQPSVCSAIYRGGLVTTNPAGSIFWRTRCGVTTVSIEHVAVKHVTELTLASEVSRDGHPFEKIIIMAKSYNKVKMYTTQIVSGILKLNCKESKSYLISAEPIMRSTHA